MQNAFNDREAVREINGPGQDFACKEAGHEAKNCPTNGKAPAAVTREASKPKRVEISGPRPASINKPTAPKSPRGEQKVPSSDDFLDVTGKNRNGKAKGAEVKNPSDKTPAPLSRPTSELGANPFHVLAGAFEVDLEDISTDAGIGSGSAEGTEVQQPMSPEAEGEPNNEREVNPGTELEDNSIAEEQNANSAGNTHVDRSEALLREAQALQNQILNMMDSGGSSARKS
ncbi:hypothetical protein R1sor_005052 [Riccia sorocarpa]|uniref:CCHC-type domain-containing protein n=1 Tax=Riccia sorocarpa TaxID=122646 RepID=A0ABD3HKN5_9MARC